MGAARGAFEAEWLGACRRIVGALTGMLDDHPTTRERAAGRGRGAGGDESLMVDIAAERLIFAELERLHAAGHRFTALSEEHGSAEFGGDDLLVVIDPIDGSLNAKRGMPSHAVSIAVADGETMADVRFGFVYDFGAGEEWYAVRGGGGHLDGRRLDPPPGERRTADGLLELLAIESADPVWVAACAERLVPIAHRLRAIGSIAISLCQVAAARVDGMATLWRCRSVDAAAAQLIVRESGGLVAFPACADPLGAPLDLAPHSAVVAARTTQALAELSSLPADPPSSER